MIYTIYDTYIVGTSLLRCAYIKEDFNKSNIYV